MNPLTLEEQDDDYDDEIEHQQALYDLGKLTDEEYYESIGEIKSFYLGENQ